MFRRPRLIFEKKYAIISLKTKKKTLNYQVETENFMICQSSTDATKNLFRDWDETMIWSCLQGVMGKIYADDEKHPQSAMAIIGDFCFFAGVPTPQITAYKPDWCKKDFMIMTANSPDWFPVIESVYRNKAKKTTRYAMNKNPEFSIKKLMNFTQNLEPDTILQPIDAKWFAYCRDNDWSRDFVSLYTDFDEYQKLGALGFLAVKNGKPVSGASAYSVYRNGIEIEICTKKEYRKQGLAAACGAKLILESLKKGLNPSWDAANPASVALAEKLGYRFNYEYTAYLIYGY